MIHTGPLPDRAGVFGEWRATERRCRHCGGPVQSRTWESRDGAYEDEQHRCTQCGRGFWTEGPDA